MAGPVLLPREEMRAGFCVAWSIKLPLAYVVSRPSALSGAFLGGQQ